MSRVRHTTSRLSRKREILLHPKSIPRLAKLGDRTMGCRTSASLLIRSVHHHDYSVHPSVPDFHSPYVSCFRSSFCFMFPFLFAISILFYSRTPNPEPRTPTLTYARFTLPCYVLFGTDTFRSSCMILSLKSTLIVPRTHHPNLRILVCLSPKI